jgi:hypothetical protein
VDTSPRAASDVAVMATAMCVDGNDTGAVRHGNFFNYYKFNSAKSRLQLLPTDLWNAKCDESFVCLDVGCNSGVNVNHFSVF